jgi:hypothetical protein
VKDRFLGHVLQDTEEKEIVLTPAGISFYPATLTFFVERPDEFRLIVQTRRVIDIGKWMKETHRQIMVMRG